MELQATYETWKGERLKSAAEVALNGLHQLHLDKLAELYAFGPQGRVVDPALRVEVAGITFDNPVWFGPGWDKKGRAVHGLYDLGFGGGEVGTVLPFSQVGNDQPRLWTIDKQHSVGLNRLGFNSLGKGPVGDYLDKAQPLPCPIGINVGRNKEMPNDMAVWAHGEVIKHLYRHASFIVLGISSPNTEDLRKLQQKGPLRDLIQGAFAAMDEVGQRVPLFIKIDAERSPAELDDMIEVVLDEQSAGFMATNTYMASDLKAKYGQRWANEAGGLSGADADYRARATATVRHIYEAAGDRLTVVGVGGVDSTSAALDKIEAGSSAVEVVTAIRPSKGRVAAQINRGLAIHMRHEGIKNISELVGANTRRGPRA